MSLKPKKSDSWRSKTVYTWEKRDLWRKKPTYNDFQFVIFYYIKIFWVEVTKNEIPKFRNFSTPTCNIPKCSSAQAWSLCGRGFLKFFVFCRFLTFTSLWNQKIAIFWPWEARKNRKIYFFLAKTAFVNLHVSSTNFFSLVEYGFGIPKFLLELLKSTKKTPALHKISIYGKIFPGKHFRPMM